jgi:hypothetical protein
MFRIVDSHRFSLHNDFFRFLADATRISPDFVPLLPPTIGENHPTIEYNTSLFAASASLDAEVRSSAFNHIAKSDLLVADKSGQAHLVRRAFTLVRMVIASDLLRHTVRLLSIAIDKT